jgi:diguanylate cyclase (GGDEF)-like protein/PAS domain S-box-containing protein
VSTRHRVLDRQLRRLGLRDDCPPNAEAWAALLGRVEAAYTDADDDRYLLERSLSISSAEMADLYEELRATSESRLAAEHARLVAVTEHSPIAMAEIDRHGRVVFENTASRVMIGASLVDSDARVRDLLHPGDRRAMDRLARRAWREGSDERATMRFTRADGQLRWARIQVRALQDDDPRWFIAITDVTDEIHARRERERLSLLLEATADLVALFDVSGQLLHLNRVGCTQLGVAPDDSLAGRNVAELFDPVSREQLHHQAFPCMQRDGEWRGEATLAGPGGNTPVSLVMLAHDQPGGVKYCSAIARDVTELKEVQRELSRQATHDGLTGLPNRALLLDRLTQAVLRARRRSSALGVLYIDLDRVKLVNDNLGHEAGDRVLVQAAERLRGCTRSPDTVGRLGGDEFVVVAEDLADPAAVLTLAERVVEVFDEPFAVDGVEVYVTASVGVALRGGSEEAAALLRDADVAMYRAKEGGGGRVELFDAQMRAWVTERFETEHALRHALEHGGLGVHYQVQVRPVTGEIVAFEALARWQHTPRGEIKPDLFIPLAEETGLIGVIGEQVTEEACRQAARWNAAGPVPVGISVNVSARQLTQPGLLELVEHSLAVSGLDPTRLTLEITESVLVQDPDLALTRLDALRALGVRLAVDDFGKGYSSLAYLQRFPLDTVKIDQIFFQNLEPGATDHTIVGSVINLAHGLGFEVVAEGVETPQQLDALVEMGCDLVQGHVMAPALPASAAGALLGAPLQPAGLSLSAARAPGPPS